MNTIVPLIVKIGLRFRGENREADHPPWSDVPLPRGTDVISGDGNHEQDYCLGSWHYSKVGHQESEADSPIGMQWGMRLVTPAFAVAAIDHFTNQVNYPNGRYEIRVISEAEAKAFYEGKVTAHMPAIRINDLVLQALRNEMELLTFINAPVDQVDRLRVKVQKAMDPDDPEPGLSRDSKKTWVLCRVAEDFVCDHSLEGLSTIPVRG